MPRKAPRLLHDCHKSVSPSCLDETSGLRECLTTKEYITDKFRNWLSFATKRQDIDRSKVICPREYEGENLWNPMLSGRSVLARDFLATFWVVVLCGRAVWSWPPCRGGPGDRAPQKTGTPRRPGPQETRTPGDQDPRRPGPGNEPGNERDEGQAGRTEE